jgi:hypothetical protein
MSEKPLSDLEIHLLTPERWDDLETLFLISIPVAAFNPTLGILVWWIAPAISFVLIRWTR